MTRPFIASLIAAPVLAMAGIHTAVAHLDAATRRQCAEQAWPVHQHAAHMEYCRVYIGAR